MGGTSSKTGFETSVKQLTTTDISPKDHQFWDELWKTNLTVEETFTSFTPDDVRRLIKDRPNNLKTLFTQAVAQLFQVVETPYPVYFDQALNCARLLSRVLPFMLENDSEMIQNLCWKRQAPHKRIAKEKSADELKDNGEEGSENEEEGEEEGQNRENEPLADVLVNAVFHLLFLPEFTIEDSKIDFTEADLDTQEFRYICIYVHIYIYM
jgi:hypothetical protein